MNELLIKQYVKENFPNTHCVVSDGDYFFSYGSGNKFPFATIVSKDNDFDNASKLDRPSIFRLNIGISKETYASLFSAIDEQNGWDFAVLDEIIPHPVYGRIHWVCVNKPSVHTFKRVMPLLMEAFEMAVKKENRHPSVGNRALVEVD